MKDNKKNKLVSKKTVIDNVNILVNDNANYGMTKEQTKKVIDNFLITINKLLIEGKDIRFLKHFTFKTAIQKAKTAVNPKTGKKINIPAKRVPKVKFSQELKERIAEKK